MKEKVAFQVAELLLQQPRHKLPINPLSLRYPFSLEFDTVEHFSCHTPAIYRDLKMIPQLRDGITIRSNNQYIILYNAEVPNKARQFFTIGHELGHIFLEHETDDSKQEEEANLFAAELLMPRILVRELCGRYKKTCDFGLSQIGQTFSVSRQAATYRINHFDHYFDATDIEIELLKRYQQFLSYPNQPIITV